MVFTTKYIEARAEWDELERAAAPHSFLQSWNWGEFHTKTGHTVYRIAMFYDARCVIFSQVFIIRAKRGSFLLCPHGPLFLDSTVKETALESLSVELQKIAKSHHCGFIRICPLSEKNTKNEVMYEKLGFRNAPTHVHPELTWVLDITPSDEELMQQMRKTTRYSIKKAEKDGVTIRQSNVPEDVEVFWKVYQETVTRQQFTPFSKDFLRTQFETFQQSDQVRWYFADYQGETISAAMIVYDGTCGYYHHGASTQAHKKIPASYLIQWHAIQEAKRRGCRLYNFYGVVPESEVNHPWAGLSLFKRGFGGFEEAYVHAQDFILSPMYWVTWGIETIRRLKRGL